ncbi:hypothetical protein [Shewanella sp. Isolate11]|uniref:hypothetical protein n=1 Tax=Shewanella sp. Isolate11 TaxID=2908530 RepID=UPI001EFEC2CD|nr:hypothetical protein [Shewanella sp. Isolate11]MCG9697684.1 hypothetical protein [Shewanella sp. Isolate11]
MKKLLLSAIVLTAITGCNADDFVDDVKQEAVRNGGVESKSDVVEASDAVVKSLQVIAQKALAQCTPIAADGSACPVSGEVDGDLVITGDESQYVITSKSNLKIDTANVEANVDLSGYDGKNEIILTQDANGNYSIELKDTTFTLSEPDNLVYNAKAADFVYDKSNDIFLDDVATGTITGEDKEKTDFSFVGGDITLD